MVSAIAYRPSWLGASRRVTTIVDTRPRTCAMVPFAVSRAAPDAARRPMSRALSGGFARRTRRLLHASRTGRVISTTIFQPSGTACLNDWSCT